jgi:hypothetical protein
MMTGFLAAPLSRGEASGFFASGGFTEKRGLSLISGRV